MEDLFQKNMVKRVMILGGGWAGLLSALKLSNTPNFSVTILEQDDENNRGGLLKSEIIDGFTFDTGGPHLLFSKNEGILKSITDILGSNCSRLRRNNYIYYREKFIEYPFENGIYNLEPVERAKFATEILNLSLSRKHLDNWMPENMMDWIEGIFGQHMAEEYLIPYNQKIWKRDLNKMAADWVFTPGRLPMPVIEDVVKMAAGIPSVGYKEQEYFFYPKNGGIQALYDSLNREVMNNGVEFIFNKKVEKIEIVHNVSYIINNAQKADRIISTIPLTELLRTIDSGNEYDSLINKMDYNSVIIVGIAISRSTPNHTSVYVPDPSIIFHRYTWMSSLVPTEKGNHSNLIVEITTAEHELNDAEMLITRVIKDLLKMNIIMDESEVLFTKIWFNRYGYPIYTLNHNEVRNEAFMILEERGIETLGRWGSWHYWNTDMVYKKVFDIL